SCNNSVSETTRLMINPKEKLEELASSDLESAIGAMLDNPRERSRFWIFFNNEYYPALIPIHDKVVLLNNAVKALLERSVLNERDREIIKTTQKLAPELFVNSEF